MANPFALKVWVCCSRSSKIKKGSGLTGPLYMRARHARDLGGESPLRLMAPTVGQGQGCSPISGATGWLVFAIRFTVTQFIFKLAFENLWNCFSGERLYELTRIFKHGDFFVGNTAFHVTVAPMPPVYDKCKKNLDEGYRAFLLVPDRLLSGARYEANNKAPGRIAVESIESFVGQNIEEISVFCNSKLVKGFLSLLETYNNRVDEAEIDKSLLIEIPQNLL